MGFNIQLTHFLKRHVFRLFGMPSICVPCYSMRHALLCLLSVSTLTACQSDTQTESNIAFSAPEGILQVRAIDPSNLLPKVTLSNGSNVTMQPTGDNAWSGTIFVKPDSTYSVSVVWIEAMPNGNLVLAQWDEENVEVGADGREINLGSGDYDYSADFDNDSITNIQERRNNTNPFIANDTTDDDADDDADNANTDDNVNTTQDDNAAGEQEADTNNDSNNDALTNDNSTNDPTDVQSNPDDDTTTNNDNADNTVDDNEDDAGSTDEPGLDRETTVATVIIPRIEHSEAPEIDGDGVELDSANRLSGEWAAAVQFDTNNEPLLIDRLMIDINADAEDGAPLRRWAAMHDGIYLYLLVLSDDTGARHGDSLAVYEDDALELFIDADNSKLDVWGDADDFHYMIPLLEFNTNKANTDSEGRILAGPNSSEVDLAIEFHTGPGKGPDGIRIAKWEQDVYELAIPLAEAGIQTAQAFGLELQLDDDDNGDGRDSKWGWHHPSRQNNTDTDTTYMNPSVMGTVILED